MSTKYTKHIVVDMDETMIQNCVICGEQICNYQNTMWEKDSGPPSGFPAGEVFIKKGFPTIIMSGTPEEDFLTCI